MWSIQKATYKKALRAHCPENSICKCSTMYGQKFKDYCLMYQESRVLWKSVHSKSGKHFQTSGEWFHCWGCMWQNLSVSAPVFCYHPWTVTDFKPATRIIFELPFLSFCVHDLSYWTTTWFVDFQHLHCCSSPLEFTVVFIVLTSVRATGNKRISACSSQLHHGI